MKWLQIMIKDDDDDDDDDDDVNTKDAEVVEIGTGEALTMLDRLVNLKHVSKEGRNFHVAIKDKLENIRVLNKKQSYINDYFVLEYIFRFKALQVAAI